MSLGHREHIAALRKLYGSPPEKDETPPVARQGFGKAQAHGNELHGDHTPIRIPAADLSHARRRCPYFAEVEAAPGNVFVFAGPQAWDRARHRRKMMGPGSTLVLPPGEDPTELRWPRMPGGCVIDARGLNRQQAVVLATCIVSAGTPLAFVIRDDEGFPVASPTWANPLRMLRGSAT